MYRLKAIDAVSEARRNAARKFPERHAERMTGTRLFPALTPSFQIEPSAAVFTIGSCFARNIEDFLTERGISVPTAGFKAPPDEAAGRPNRILNQYNPGTMLQVVRDSDGQLGERAIYPKAPTAPDAVVDCLVSTGGRTVTPERAMARREEIRSLYRDGLAASETVIVTLGLIECWYDLEHEVYLNDIPPLGLLRSAPDRFEFRQLDVAEAQRLVYEMMECLFDQPRRRVLLTVSPVPIQSTFMDSDVITANCYSKSVLRCVAEMATQDFAGIDYFPSYEIVTSGGTTSFMADNVHVRDDVVQQATAHMLAHYLS